MKVSQLISVLSQDTVYAVKIDSNYHDCPILYLGYAHEFESAANADFLDYSVVRLENNTIYVEEYAPFPRNVYYRGEYCLAVEEIISNQLWISLYSLDYHSEKIASVKRRDIRFNGQKQGFCIIERLDGEQWKSR